MVQNARRVAFDSTHKTLTGTLKSIHTGEILILCKQALGSGNPFRMRIPLQPKYINTSWGVWVNSKLNPWAFNFFVGEVSIFSDDKK